MNKLSSLFLIALVCSMIVSSMPNIVHADSQTDSLIKIATQARDQLRIQLSKTSDISDEIKTKFEDGSHRIELLKESATQNNVAEARKHFLAAMKIFNNISKRISEQSSETNLTSQTSTFSNELDRLYLYVERLKQIASKNDISIEFEVVDQLINTARKYLSEKEFEKASSETEKIKKEIIRLNNELQEKTQQHTAARAKDFAQKHLEQLDSLILQAQKLGVSQNTIDRLLNAKANLDSATNVDQIIREVKHLISVKEEFENTKEQRIKSRINQLDSKYNNLSTHDSENIESLNKAKTMLDELKKIITENKLDEAIILISSLNNLLNEIETSLDSKNEETDSKDKDNLDSLSDSKIDRIKIKIQRLEADMKKLDAQIEGNAAAKRWLDNAFLLLDDTKNLVDKSPNRALEIIKKIEEIIARVQNTIQ